MRKSQAKKLLEKELRVTPIVSFACKKVGISRQSYYRWFREDTDFKASMRAVIYEEVQHINDMSENQIINLIQQGNFPAVKFWLSNNHNRFNDRSRYDVEHEERQRIKNEKLQKILDKVNLSDPAWDGIFNR